MARSNGEGSIFRRDNGLWVGRIELPPRDGKRRRKEFTSVSHSAVIRKMSQLRAQLENAGDLPTDNMTVEQWNAYWLREIASKDRRPKSMAAYRSALKWVDRAIGNTKMDRLSPTSVRKVLALMADPPDRDPLSSTYMMAVHGVMSASFGDAEREGRIPRNPVDLVKAPPKAAKQLEVLSPDEALRLINTFAGTPDAYLWATYLLTGARRGEILGLEWDRVGDDLDLSWQLQSLRKGESVPANFERREATDALWWTRPKSRAGWRVIPLVDPLKAILNSWRELAPANPWGLVFTRPDENGNPIPIHPDYASAMWPTVRKAAGIDRAVRLHDLRHTTVDLLYAAGVPEEIIPDIVGHSTRAMSRSYRSGANRDRVLAAMRQLSASLGYPES